ncbi:tyrosine-type recombinase/integrase [Desulfopila aestuarii]|uniref:Site-specific recombinase XerD n=1 Tax=Desulfopila aestuarii DSM 18488 TaxID=1121416 RepID=A0A1M7YH91_9BACT|nr:integrase family protein [Desulfopila aestuarii]SHO51951.1 Site-specific recombinase XerD [Desulfopila aestuarii DSM 18488]
MSTAITTRTLNKLKPAGQPYFLRDTTLNGFGVKVNTSGKISFVSEVWHGGRSYRKTLGSYPILQLQQARNDALAFMSSVRSGDSQRSKSAQMVLEKLFKQYTASGRLKPRTVQDYQEAVFFYLSDWLKKPVSSITKQMVEKKFYQIRDKGINGGKPTYSQATKVMRILSALMNYAKADEMIESNPVEVLKLKRIDRSIKKRENYLPAHKVRELLKITAPESHPMTLAVHLMLYSGLRKNEALRLKWSDLEHVEGLQCLVIRDTKNHRPHYVPVTEEIQKVLQRAANQTQYIFPSPLQSDTYIKDERPTLKRLSKLINMEFKCHDLRRTFATRASEVGIDYLTVKRMLNHRSNDITAQYIQWNSRQNLLVLKDALEQVAY